MFVFLEERNKIPVFPLFFFVKTKSRDFFLPSRDLLKVSGNLFSFLVKKNKVHELCFYSWAMQKEFVIFFCFWGCFFFPEEDPLILFCFFMR